MACSPVVEHCIMNLMARSKRRLTSNVLGQGEVAVRLRFNFEKSLQAAGVLLQLEDGRMPSLRLLRLLYIADRELLAETAIPITGDRVRAMKCGPVLSDVYSLIRGEATRSGDWSAHVQTQGYAVKLIHDPGRGKLSKGEVEKLTEVSERHRNRDQWELSDLIREFPEWRRNLPTEDETHRLIPWADVLEAQGEAELTKAVEEQEAARLYLDEVFGE